MPDVDISGSTFIELLTHPDDSGGVIHSDIDYYVQQWHRGAYTQSLANFLGLTKEEYKYWAETGDVAAIGLSRANVENSTKVVRETLYIRR